MDENKINAVVICCFCGIELNIKDAVTLVIYPIYNNDESQQLFCHRNHLREKLLKSIPLHPDILSN
jgi:hypothetical protein